MLFLVKGPILCTFSDLLFIPNARLSSLTQQTEPSAGSGCLKLQRERSRGSLWHHKGPSQLWPITPGYRYWIITWTRVTLQHYAFFLSNQTFVLSQARNPSRTLLGTEKIKHDEAECSNPVSRPSDWSLATWHFKPTYPRPVFFVLKYLFRITFFLSTWTIRWRRGIVTVSSEIAIFF